MDPARKKFRVSYICHAGLPDGLCILRPKIPVWIFFGRLWKFGMENGGTYTYFMAIWNGKWYIGIFCGHLVAVMYM
jgi:hypothetical protein